MARILLQFSQILQLDSNLVQLHQRRVVENPFVSAHCYFEAVSHSNPLTAGMPAKNGAKLVRSVYSHAYVESVVRRTLKSWAQETHQQLNPDCDPEVDFVGTDWHPSWFNDRSELMRTVDCTTSSSSLWVYNLDTENFGYPLVLYRPLAIVNDKRFTLTVARPDYNGARAFAMESFDSLSDFRESDKHAKEALTVRWEQRGDKPEGIDAEQLNDCDAWGYTNVLKLARLTLLTLADSSICERGHAWYNRMHTKERANLKLKAVRSAFAVKNFGPASIRDFKASVLYDSRMSFVAPGDITGTPGAVPRRRRNLVALMKKTMAKAVNSSNEKLQPTGDI